MQFAYCYSISYVVYYTCPEGQKGEIAMTMNEFAEKLNQWIDDYGWDDESLNNFVNINASSYEEYNAMWEIVHELV